MAIDGMGPALSLLRSRPTPPPRPPSPSPLRGAHPVPRIPAPLHPSPQKLAPPAVPHHTACPPRLTPSTCPRRQGPSPGLSSCIPATTWAWPWSEPSEDSLQGPRTGCRMPSPGVRLQRLPLRRGHSSPRALPEGQLALFSQREIPLLESKQGALCHISSRQASPRGPLT